jgi:hypothetical protein
MTEVQGSAPLFSAPYAADDCAIAAQLLAQQSPLTLKANARIDRTTTRLIHAIRAQDRGFGGVEDMLREFALSTKEGLALMVLAEALLRVPDAATADRLSRINSDRAISLTTGQNPRPFLSMLLHGRLVYQPASFSPAKRHKILQASLPSGSGFRRCAPPHVRPCG